MSITIRNISKTFGAFQALNNVSLEVPSGELTALLGPSGSGKTTLLRIVAGLESADEGADGQILFDGVPVTDNPVNRRKVGFVFQHYALFRHMTVFENIAFGLRVKPRADRPSNEAIKDRVFELLKLVQLEQLAQRFPAQLSGGQRQRIAIARALILEPQILLLDEPTSALDASVQAEVLNLLEDLRRRRGLSFIMVSHDLAVVTHMCERLMVMQRGHTVEVLAAADLAAARTTNDYTRRLMLASSGFHREAVLGEHQ